MGKSKTRKQNDRETLINDTIANSRNFVGDYRGQSVKRLQLTNCKFLGAKLDDAAVTASRFWDCHFKNCSMNMGDFEYCDFYNCQITSQKPISVAFSNSNFINSFIYNLKFYSSTFANAFFNNTQFDRISIENCTLESAAFHHCFFTDLDMSMNNMDFAEFYASHFQKTTLPMSQIPYTFGLLQHILDTKNEINIVGNNKIITCKEYIDTVIPTLLNFYMKSPNMEPFYFPLINILLSINEIDEANTYLKKALNLSAHVQDYRMIKHYCKLLNQSEKYTYKHKKAIYEKLHSQFKPEVMTPWELKSFSRNIGDIKYILLMENNLPMLIFNIGTNIIQSGIERIGYIIKDIFTISKKYNSSPQHDIHIEITRNSPVMINVQFTETIENIIALLRELICFTCYSLDANHLQIQQEYFNADDFQNIDLFYGSTIKNYIQEYESFGIKLSFMGFQIENWKSEYSPFCKEISKYNNIPALTMANF